MDRLHPRRRITAPERDEIITDLRELMQKHDCSPHTLRLLALIAQREAGQ